MPRIKGHTRNGTFQHRGEVSEAQLEGSRQPSESFCCGVRDAYIYTAYAVFVDTVSVARKQPIVARISTGERPTDVLHPWVLFAFDSLTSGFYS